VAPEATSARLANGAAVVMPVYNEEATICSVLDTVLHWFSGVIVVVDDGSTDGTRECLAGRDDISVVRHEVNAGYGASLIDGFEATVRLGVDAVVTMDCDGQHEPEHIPSFLSALAEADIVSGSRYLPGSAALGTTPAERADVNATVTASINAVTGWRLTDAFCGFKAYRSTALATLDLNEAGYAMPLQLWAQAWRADLRVVELPVERIYNHDDRSFGADLDDARKRLAYYDRVWRASLGEDGPAGGGVLS
jgi:dolichol-phosphate mannosyltransferase